MNNQILSGDGKTTRSIAAEILGEDEMKYWDMGFRARDAEVKKLVEALRGIAENIILDFPGNYSLKLKALELLKPYQKEEGK